MRSFEIGDKVEHTNSHRIGAVQEIRSCRDGTFELRVHVHALDVWWNSRHVRNLTAEDEGRSDGFIPADNCRGQGTHLRQCDDDGYCSLCGEQE